MLRILDHSWHQVHLYRLHALPAEFTILNVRNWVWREEQRPTPLNLRGAIETDAVGLGQFDLALCHLDQWIDRFPHRGLPFRVMTQLARRLDLPAVCIMHGTPDYPENRVNLLRLLGDVPCVCNSQAAAEEWDGGEGRLDRYGLPQFRSIIHGYDADEFWSEPACRRRRVAISVCSGGSTSAWYHGTPILERLIRDVPLEWYGPYGNRDWLPSYGEYREMLASSLIYFSPTHRAPMPGARTEAALSGCCVVSVPGQDWHEYIEQGVNGYIVNSYADTVRALRVLLDDHERAWRIGQAGREMAQERFGVERYVNDWLALLEELGVV
jgi:hypothetical protein